MTDERERFARLTAEIFGEAAREEHPGQNRATTRKVNRALRLGERLLKEDPGYRPAVDALRRMKARRS